jgi:hypothetical protein
MRDHSKSKTWRLWSLGAASWLAVLVARWPLGLSFGDEVGYVGQMRLVLQGRVRPLPTDAGVWVSTPHGIVAKFPYLVPLLEAPLFAISPRLIFVPSMLAAVVLALVAANVLRAWGRRPAWGLVILAYPPVVLLSRTTMTDLVLTALVVGGWWSMRRQRTIPAAALLAAATATKAIGFVLVGLLAAGETWRIIELRRRGERPPLRPLLGLLFGATIGFAVGAAFNVLANGTPWSVYDEAHSYLHTPAFWPQYLPTSAPAHLASLLLAPPLLIAGVWPLWQRRELGPVLLIGGLVSMMCFYFFVDRGRSFTETLIMSPRLILPAVAFLLIGYAELLASLLDRLQLGAWPRLAVLAPALICLVLSAAHRRWQIPGARALAALGRLADAAGTTDVGMTWSAVKTGIFYRGPITVAVDRHQPAIVLCSTHYASYRDPNEQFSCALPGYREGVASDEFHILTREDPSVGTGQR